MELLLNFAFEDLSFGSFDERIKKVSEKLVLSGLNYYKYHGLRWGLNMGLQTKKVACRSIRLISTNKHILIAKTKRPFVKFGQMPPSGIFG